MNETLRKVSGKFLILLLIAGLAFAVAAVLSTVEASAAAQHFEVTTKAGLNLRQSTSTKSSVLKTIPYNTTIKITDYKTANGYDWGKTTYGGKTGWLAMKYVEPCARIKDGTYVISPKCAPNSGLDVGGKSKANGANVQIWNITDGGGDNQHFKITYLNNGFYKITAVHSGKVLDVSNGSSASEANVQQYAWNGTYAQQWQIIDGGNGYCIISNRIADKVLDVDNASSKNGTNVWVYNRNNTSAQLWKIKKFSNSSASNTKASYYESKVGKVIAGISSYRTNLDGYKGIKGQCVWYVRNRGYELLGKSGLTGIGGNAKTWYNSAKKKGLKTGSTPKTNSIACFGGGSYGHVIYVEYYDSASKTVYFTEANCSKAKDGQLQKASLSNFKKHSSGYKGCIYL